MTKRPKHLSPLLAEKGISSSELARRLVLNKSSISRWDENGVPLERVPEVEKATGIPREKLRPDYFSAGAPQ